MAGIQKTNVARLLYKAKFATTATHIIITNNNFFILAIF